MINICLSIMCFFIIPILLGSLITHFMKNDSENILLSWIIGFFIEFTIGEIITVLFTFLGNSFNSLFYCYFGICIILASISLLLNWKNIKFNNKEEISQRAKLVKYMCFFLIGIQCFVVFCFMHIDSDDSNFVAKATISIDTNSLYVYNDEGGKYDIFPARYVLSPFPMYIALISKFTGFHPMIMAHTILPVILILLIYSNYFILGEKIFNKDKKKSYIFLFFINILYIFGNFSTRSNFTFMLVRLWQGKAILANLILPSIISFYLMYIKENEKLAYWLVLLLVMFSSCFVSTMGLALAPIMLISNTIAYCFSKIEIKKIKTSIKAILKLGIKSSLCCLPNIFFMVIYLLLKGEAG